MAEQAKIRYNLKERVFFQTLHGRVEQYFKSNQLKKTGGWRAIVKTIFMFTMYLTPYFLMVCGVVTGFPALLLLAVMMGLGMAFIGLSVMHDANHGSYSSNRKVNKIVSYSMNLIGGHYLNWQVQHNTLHHTYTNIEGHDEDIAPPGFLRFSPHSEYRKIHRFQFLYAWFFYGLMTLMWVTTKDFKQLARYNRMGLLQSARVKYKNQLWLLIATKLLYWAYMLVIPMLVMDVAWWVVPVLFIIVHFVAGLTLALIFQPAHVIEETAFPLPDNSGNMENDWAVHQLFTTANFAPRNHILTWLVGGLNYQVEHHLFPAISHIHYRKLSVIVRETAQEFNYPYHSYNTFFGAIGSHARMLVKFGKAAA